MILRDYQAAAVAQVLGRLPRRTILVSPTGSGKTITAVELVRRLAMPTLWIAHRRELVLQAAERLRHYDLKVGVIMADEPIDASAQIQVAAVQTLIRRTYPAASLVIIDECHHASANTYCRVLEAYPDANIVGLTATPFRLDGRGLGDIFETIVVAATTADLCKRGILHAPRVFASSAPDLRGIRTRRGDYDLRALARETNTCELVGDIVATWKRHAPGRKTVAFAVDIAHSQSIVAAFREAGVAAEHLDGEAQDRDEILARLKTGQTTIISNCMVLTEGWDLPALECAIIARPTASLGLHLQMIGRVMRACHGKEGAIVLDHAGNHYVHGLVTNEIEYSLNTTAAAGPTEPLNLRRCNVCYALFSSELENCPECGAETGAAPKKVVTRPGELVEIAEQFEAHKTLWISLESQRIAKNYKQGWSIHRFHEVTGAYPVLAEIDGKTEIINPASATGREKRGVYARLLAVAKARGYNPGWASHEYRRAFGAWPRGFVEEVRAGR